MNSDIRIAVSFKGHRKRKRLQMILGPGSTDYLLDLWISAAMSRPEGTLTGWDELDICSEAGWCGDPNIYVDALMKAGFLDRSDDGTYVLHDWPEHNGYASAANKRSEKARKAAIRKWERRMGESDEMLEQCPSNAQAMPKPKTSYAPSPNPSPSPSPKEKTTTTVVVTERLRVEDGTGATKPVVVFSEETENPEIQESHPVAPGLGALLALVPDDASRGLCAQDVSEYLEAKGAEYCERCIRYANRNARENYPAYLAKALKNDYGKVVAAREAAASKKKKSDLGRKRQEIEREEIQDALFKEAERRYESLAPEEKGRLRDNLVRGAPFMAGCRESFIRSVIIQNLVEQGGLIDGNDNRLQGNGSGS